MSDMFIVHESEEHRLLLTLHCSDTLSVEETAEKAVSKGSPHFVKHRSDLPEYIASPFYDALVADFEKETVSIDMEKARLITQDIIREERVKAFEVLDVEYMRASEAQDTEKMAEVVAKKQVLRDLPASPAIQEAKTPEELVTLAKNAVEV